MAIADCPNYTTNLEMCVCTNEGCDNRGYCCLCLAAHLNGGSLTACLSRPRPAASLDLRGVTEGCPRREETRLVCACGGDTCERYALCCECLRNHWTADATGRTSCFKGA